VYLNGQIYTGIGNIFDKCFNEPYEIAYAISDDGKVFMFTSREDDRISISAYYRKRFIEDNGSSIDRIIILIHSHVFGPKRFSTKDIEFLNKMKGYGFTGKYILYHKPSGEYLTHKERE
jgi:hypothetical protein